VRLLVSRLTKDHIGDDYLATLNDSTYMELSRHKDSQNTIESQQKYLSGFDFMSNFLLAITDQQSGQLVATATLRVLPGNEIVNIGFLVIKKFSSQGYGKQILQKLSLWVFDLFPTMTQQIGTRRENIAMQKIALSSEFYEEVQFETRDYVYFMRKPSLLPEILTSKNSEFHIVCNDIGGAYHISTLVNALFLKGTATLSGPAKGVFTDSCPSLPTIEIAPNLIANKIILLGSGFFGGIESKTLESKMLSANRKIVLLDHWVNYRQRFSPSPQILPDVFLVTNKQAEFLARDCFPQTAIERIPDFLLAEQKRRFLSKEASPESVLFILEPDALIGEGLKYRIGKIEQYLEVILCYLRTKGITRVVVRNHPSQKYQLGLDAVKLPSDFQISYSGNKSLVDDLLCAKAVFGFHSSALYASAMLGIETFSFFAGAAGHWTNLFTEISKVD
jgi:RimJ/RimL family protein N-acetyltransferase